MKSESRRRVQQAVPPTKMHTTFTRGSLLRTTSTFELSFFRIYQHRRQGGAISIVDGLWPSQEEIEELVDRAGEQFIFAATVVRFVDDFSSHL